MTTFAILSGIFVVVMSAALVWALWAITTTVADWVYEVTNQSLLLGLLAGYVVLMALLALLTIGSFLLWDNLLLTA